MDNKVTFRTFKEGDYEICQNWWRRWWGEEMHVRREILLISCIEVEAKDVWDVQLFYTVADNKQMERIFRKLDWYIEDSAPTYGCYKVLS